MSSNLGRHFHEQVWDWVNNDTDVRIVYKNEARSLSLSEFETLELQETGTIGVENTGQLQGDPQQDIHQIPPAVPTRSVVPASFRDSLRQRLSAEGHALGQEPALGPTKVPQLHPQSKDERFTESDFNNKLVTTYELPNPISEPVALVPTNFLSIAQLPKNFHKNRPNAKKRGRRKIPKGTRLTEPIFDDPSTSTTTPRLYASQNRIWHAVAGHSVDLKRLPSMEFMLLSIIAAHGASGIAQPDLTRISAQDKRSVPHRTDELAKKGYIEKKPMQAYKARTSLCIHKKFVQEGHFLKGPGVVEDVFRDNKFMLSGFVDLLYNLLKTTDIVAMRDLRRKLVGTLG